MMGQMEDIFDALILDYQNQMLGKPREVGESDDE